MAQLEDMTMTEKYGMLTVIGKAHKSKREKRWIYECLCDCGEITYRAMNQLKYSRSVHSCGCYRSEVSKTHGMKYTRVYRIWRGMKQRCKNPNDKDFEKYSERGICDEWMGFEKFYKDMGDPPTELHQIDRVDNDGMYCKGNCKWSTISEQARNRAISKTWSIDGKHFDSLSDVSDHLGISIQASHRRFVGYLSRGKEYPPKKGYSVKNKYEVKS
jgi:hypothetical protein